MTFPLLHRHGDLDLILGYNVVYLTSVALLPLVRIQQQFLIHSLDGLEIQLVSDTYIL